MHGLVWWCARTELVVCIACEDLQGDIDSFAVAQLDVCHLLGASSWLSSCLRRLGLVVVLIQLRHHPA
eukprot:COSAG05_NODE_1739_length_4161_cov_4.587642_3_plen_68_part_00